MVLRILCLTLLLLCSVTTIALPAPEQAPEKQSGEAVAPTFPSLSELGARSAALTDFVAKSEERLQQLADLSSLEEGLTELKVQFDSTAAEIGQLGPPEDWYVDRLNHYLSLLGQIKQGFTTLQDKFATRQQEVDVIRSQIQQDQTFWSDWGGSLKEQGVKLPTQTISHVRQQLTSLQNSLKNTEAKLLKLQEKGAAFQQDLLLDIDQLASALDNLRKATFRRNTYSFFSAKFYRQFTPELFAHANTGLKSALKFDLRYLQSSAWLYALFGGSLLFAAGMLSYNRQRLTTDRGELPLILRQPLAAAGFLFVIACWIWLPPPPALFRFTLSVIGILAVTTLALAMMESRRQIRILLLAAGVFLLTNFFRLIALPQPLFRVYIVLLGIILVPLLIQQIKLSRIRCEGGQKKLFRALMRLAVAILAISLFTQLAGYMNFSTWLTQATFETGVVFLFVHIAIVLLDDTIDLIRQSQLDNQFFNTFGKELSLRLKHFFRGVLCLSAFFYLLPVWRWFTTMRDGWDYFNSLSVPIGNFELTLQMVASALVAFYLALQASWLLQAVTGTQLHNRGADRGVQEAVKKLIHYAIVLVGFMLALSMLGMGIQNFVVLLGAFGVGIGFGLQDIVNNFLSGLILLFERPIKVGDGVLIDGEYGTVTRIGLRSTVVQNLDEAELIVPNSQMISQKVTNWTLSNRRVRLVVPVGVAYGSDLEKVLAILTKTAAEHPEILDMPKPTPLFVNFGASSLDFELRVWISNVDNRPRIKNELLLGIDRRFRAEKIEIPFSQHDLHIRSVSPGVFPEPPREG